MDRYITRHRFNFLASNLLKEITPEKYHSVIDSDKLIHDIFKGTSQKLSYKDLLNSRFILTNQILRAFVKQVILADYSLSKFEKNENLNIQFVWRLIFDILLTLYNNSASIGSQGFISIELYRYETQAGDRKILRLHIWHETFFELFKKNYQKKYVIHSHLYNAQSFVLCGSVLNKRYSVLKTEKETDLSLNKIVWVDSSKTNDGYKRISHLESTTNNISTNELSSEEIQESQMYNVLVDEFHSTESLNNITATLFLFDSSKGRSDFSQVVGPKNDSDPGFKYDQVNIIPLLYQIDQKIKTLNNKHKLLALDWMRKIHTLEHAHRIESRDLKLWNELLSWAMVIIPAFTSGLSIVLKSLDPEQLKDSYLFLIAITAGLSTLIGTIIRVLQPGKSSETHRINSERFEHLRHKIETHLIFHADERLEKFLEDVRGEWERLTLLNVNESNFKLAQYYIEKLGKYPENLGFLDDYFK